MKCNSNLKSSHLKIARESIKHAMKYQENLFVENNESPLIKEKNRKEKIVMVIVCSSEKV